MTQLPRRVLVAVVIVAALGGCATEMPELGPTLADMEPVTIPVDVEPLPQASLEDIEESYRAALEVTEDPVIRQRIQLRLANIEMARSEEAQVTASEQATFFEHAIGLYRDLLQNSEPSSTAAITGDALPDEDEAVAFPRERLLYQLAKAYALDGRLEESVATMEQLVEEYPDSIYAPEANFRRAELAFSEGEYRRAEQLYNRVLSAGQTPFYSNAVYMHGWSLFKQNRYEPALRSFMLAVDDLVVEGVPLEQLEQSRQNLLADTLRIMAIGFSYLDGAETVAELSEDAGRPGYQYLLYQTLGDLYREQERYRDAADTYQRFTAFYPDSEHAPQLSVRAIKTFEAGNFPSLVRPAKEAFVEKYGPNSMFWEMRSLIQQEPLLPHLHQYLDELASYYHSQGQAVSGGGGDESAAQIDEADRNFLRAADYYRQFMTTFPLDEKVSDMAFLMAEAYYEGGALVEALDAYEQVAYHYLDPDHGADAGYAAVLTSQQLIEATPQDAQPQVYREWQDHKIRNALDFAEYYPEDKRAAPVLATAAGELFEDGETKWALDLATRLTEWEPTPSDNLLKTAWLIRSHSLFEMELYSAAEESYRRTLQRLPAEDEDRDEVVERIAASMYKQAESQLAANNMRRAIEQLLQIREVAPDSEIAINSQYDAANYLMDLNQWQEAEQVLIDFRERYPNSELVATLPPKLAVIYQELGNWGAAAGAVKAMVANEPDADARRQQLYLAAELYEKAGDTQQAIEHYRRYAHDYEQPFDLATEARYKMVQLYEKTGESLKRNYWLKQLMDAHEDARDNGGSTDRARYLAAYSARELAEVEYNAFSQIRLSIPIKQSLQRKRKAMEDALESYRKVLNYGVAEFTTEANNRIGMVYAELSRDLMDSERPEGLNALELEQYEILLEEQAFPFEEKAIQIHEANAQRSWDGTYDDWVQRSFDTLARLLPARYGKEEERSEVSDGIY